MLGSCSRQDKPEITYGYCVRIQDLTERFISLDSDFKKHNFHIIELVDEEDEETLKREQTVLNDHDDRMNEIMDRITQLNHTMAAEPSQFLRRRLNHMESTLTSINLTFGFLTPGPTLDTSLSRTIALQLNL